MTSRTRTIVVAAGIAFVVAAIVAYLVTMNGNRSDRTGWPPAERAAFMRNCVEQCRNSPGVTADKYPICDKACTCAADEGEKTMTVDDLAAAAQAISSGKASPKQTAMMDGLKAAGARCAAGGR
jgi:hypothetical protein